MRRTIFVVRPLLLMYMLLGNIAFYAQAQGTLDVPVQPGEKFMTMSLYQAPYPFTADELRAKLLKVVEMSKDSVRKEQVERIFGITLLQQNPSERLGDKTPNHFVAGGGNWYFNLRVTAISATESRFYFGWSQTPGQAQVAFPPPPSGMCVDTSKILPIIEQHGWKLRDKIRVHDLPPTNVYRKGKRGMLVIDFQPQTNCLVSIQISYANDILD